MPRTGSEAGYDVVDVCAFCIEYLLISAASRNQLRATPIAKLRAYLKAFNIAAPGALEKEDIVQAVLGARVSSCVDRRASPLITRFYTSTAGAWRFTTGE